MAATTSSARDYIIPAPVRSAPDGSGILRRRQGGDGFGRRAKPIEDFDAYRHALKSRLNPTTSVLTQVYAQVKAEPQAGDLRRGRERDRAARRDPVSRFRLWRAGAGRAHQAVLDKMAELGVADPESYEIQNSANSPHVDPDGRDALRAAATARLS
jgi:malate dehydrogenase (oxaloacetate-decarboxylating)(NADP+)